MREKTLAPLIAGRSTFGSLAVIAFAAGVAYFLPDRPRQPAVMPEDRRTPARAADPNKSPAKHHDGSPGRSADSPAEIPSRGWLDILKRTYQQVGDDRLLAVAAGVVFYGLLALFPAITALVSSYALFADPATVSEHLAFISNMLPQGAMGIVQDQIHRVLEKGDTKLGFAFAFSLLLAFWSANGGMKAIIDALNVVYDEDEKRGFIKLNSVSLAFTVGGIVAILLCLAAVVGAPIILKTFGLGSIGDALVRYGRWPALLLMMLVGLAVLYRFAPSRKSPKWKWVSAGSIVATVTWLLGSAALSYYISNFAGYDATYGSLGAAIGLMMWMWMSTIVILFGAELNSEVEHQTAKDSTTGPDQPIGARGAEAADSVR
jgi:membrane protein